MRSLSIRVPLLLACLAQPAHTEVHSAFVQGSDLSWKQTYSSLALLEGKRIIWQFNYDKSQAKSYFHPITAIDGTVLTALHPADHPWHRGLWWSWKYINGLNYWNEDKNGQSEGKTVIIRVSATPHKDYSATIHMDLAYQPPGGPPVLTEKREIEVTRLGLDGSFVIDWRASFTAGNLPVVLDRTPISGQFGGTAFGGYAGLSLRLSEASSHWDFQNSENGHGESEIHGQTARWVSFSGANGIGFRIMDDEKTNPRFPPAWYASRKLRYLGPAFLFESAYTLQPGENLEFAYRIFVNRGRPVGGEAANETVVRIATIPGKMSYDIDSFQVAPSASVALTLTNDDDMIHNLVICQVATDFDSVLGKKALELDDDALRRNFVPDIPEVLFHTPLVEPGHAETIRFVAPAETGKYPFFCTLPGHWALMRGVMHVTGDMSGASPPHPPVEKIPPVLELVVGKTARVDRLPLPECSPKALAVGLPGGLNYCFDAENLAVRYVWHGRYLDAGPNFTGRGGETVRVLGERLPVGYQENGLWLGKGPPSSRAFIGYKIGRTVWMLYAIDDVAITQAVETADRGIQYTFEVQPTDRDIHFKIDANGLRVSSSKGVWKDGVLTVAHGKFAPTIFTVTIDHD